MESRSPWRAGVAARPSALTFRSLRRIRKRVQAGARPVGGARRRAIEVALIRDTRLLDSLQLLEALRAIELGFVARGPGFTQERNILGQGPRTVVARVGVDASTQQMQLRRERATRGGVEQRFTGTERVIEPFCALQAADLEPLDL